MTGPADQRSPGVYERGFMIRFCTIIINVLLSFSSFEVPIE